MGAGDQLGSSTGAASAPNTEPSLQPSDLFLVTIYSLCESQTAVRAAFPIEGERLMEFPHSASA